MSNWFKGNKMNINIKCKFSVLLALMLSFCLHVRADENDELIVKGNNLYAEGKYQESIDSYQQVMKNGMEASELFFNLGNAYFKSGEVPSAILYYEKALRIAPKDEDILYNLEVSNGLITDKIDEVPVLFYNRWKTSIYNWFSPNGWAILASILFVIVLVSTAIFYLANTIAIRKFAFILGVILLSLDIFSFAFAYQKYRDFTQLREAIVFEPTLNVNSSPDTNSKEIFVIHEGTKVEILDSLDDWYRVKIANGSDGWVKRQFVKEI